MHHISSTSPDMAMTPPTVAYTITSVTTHAQSPPKFPLTHAVQFVEGSNAVEEQLQYVWLAACDQLQIARDVLQSGHGSQKGPAKFPAHVEQSVPDVPGGQTHLPVPVIPSSQ